MSATETTRDDSGGRSILSILRLSRARRSSVLRQRFSAISTLADERVRCAHSYRPPVNLPCVRICPYAVQSILRAFVKAATSFPELQSFSCRLDERAPRALSADSELSSRPESKGFLVLGPRINITQHHIVEHPLAACLQGNSNTNSLIAIMTSQALLSLHSLVTQDASSLARQLDAGKLTSALLVESCLEQIEAHNHAGMQLRALISVAPKDVLLAKAHELDASRAAGNIKSRLHGIPIVLKDSFLTGSELGMPTSMGTAAFASAYGRQGAHGTVVQRLLDAGLIVLGKANMTELTGMKTMGCIGWSAAGGQTQSPYIAGGDDPEDGIIGHSSAGGSSSGSGAAVAGGFSPLSLGTETVGSVIVPAGRAGLYALKVTNRGDAPADRIQSLSKTYDGVGGLAKTATDLRQLMSIIMNKPNLLKANVEKIDWTSIKIGFLNTKDWTLGREACNSTDEIDHEMNVCNTSFRIESFKADDQIGYNKQEELIKAQDDTTDPAENKRKRDEQYRLALTEATRALEENDVDLIAGPIDSGLACYSSAACWPNAAVPLGAISTMNRPFGLCIIARANEEARLLDFMDAWQSLFPTRPLPHALLDYDAKRTQLDKDAIVTL
ncbi:hypothetical protein MRB53_038207 [Persea americana]|nr:hypothetical protein MRB53_038207 [Persea americana]